MLALFPACRAGGERIGDLGALQRPALDAVCLFPNVPVQPPPAPAASPGNPLSTPYEYQRPPAGGQGGRGQGGSGAPAGAFQPDAKSNLASPGNPLAGAYEYARPPAQPGARGVGFQPDPKSNISSPDNPLAAYGGRR